MMIITSSIITNSICQNLLFNTLSNKDGYSDKNNKYTEKHKKFSDWFDENFSWFIMNPLRTWWKARKYFRRPKIEFHFFKDIAYNCPFATFNNVAKIIEIRSVDVQWKDKYNEPRHETDPYIWVCFFRKFGFSINFKIYFNEDGKKQDGGMYYWEYLLDFLYYRKDINKVDEWKRMDGTIVPTKEFSLKKKWYKNENSRTSKKYML